MGKKLKLATIVGTRPELIRLSETIKKADVYFEHSFIHTGQNYDVNLNDIFYDDLNLRKPDYCLNSVGSNLGESIGNIIAKSFSILSETKPDAVLILGDTNSALSAISAKRLKIPIFHMEAGNRCFDENVPEEINRRIVDHISDVNLPYTEHARRNLLSEGIRSEYIFVTGSPMREIIEANEDKIKASSIVCQMKLEKRKYIILSSHREENIDNKETFNNLMSAVNALAEKYNMPVIYSVHPRSAKFIEERGFKFHELVKKSPPFGFTNYISLQKNAFCVISDSGTLAEESAICGFPSVSIRTSTERPEGLDKGVFVLGSVEETQLLQAVETVIGMYQSGVHGETVVDYGDKNVSGKVIKLIQGYTDVVNRNVWRDRFIR